MKLPKYIAYILICGLLIGGAASPRSFRMGFAEIQETPKVSSESLMSVSGGEQEIDAFSVHPANRWNNESSGLITSLVNNGELSLETYSNTTSFQTFYRASSASSDNINIRWRLNSTGDFAIPLLGLNATTVETADGLANVTLSAFPYDSTHYVVRATMTTDDGTNSRSWNLESEYQDYAQMKGAWGSAGWDFIQDSNVPDATNAMTDFVYLGSMAFNSSGTNAAFGWGTGQGGIDLGINYTIFNQLEIRVWTNATSDTDIILYYYNESSDILNPDGTLLGTPANDVWTTYYYNLTSDPNWTETLWGLRIDPGNATDQSWKIDYIRLTTNNDTSDLTLFNFNTYYRAELGFDVQYSTLDYEVQNDDGRKQIKETIYSFSINDFFETDELIPDILQAETGNIDYLLGTVTAGSNTTCWWDYYEADFASFAWNCIGLYETDDVWEGVGPYGCHSDADGSQSSAVADFELVVPEFDACSGRVVIDEAENWDKVRGRFHIDFYSVDSQTGARNREMNLHADTTVASTPFVDGFYDMGGASTTIDDIDISQGIAEENYLEYTFTLHFDKQNGLLSFQLSGKDAAGLEKRAAASWPIASDSNEIIIVTRFEAIFTSIGSGAQVFLSLEDWILTARDIFGLPIDLPSIDETGGGFLGGLLAPLVELVVLFGSVPGLLLKAVSEIRSLGDIFSLFGDAFEYALEGLATAFDLSLETLGSAITEALVALWEGLDELIIGNVIDMVAAYLIDPALEAVEGFIWGIKIEGISIGSVLDVVFTWLSYFTTTAGDTLEFTAMMLTEWGDILIVAIFLGILFFAIAGSNAPGEIWGKIFKAYSMNVTPFTVFGFRAHIPLAALVIPYLFIRVLGII